MSNETHPANRRQPAQPRRKIGPTAMKTVSGIPLWPSRDPIGEEGGVNLYGNNDNNPISLIDGLGLRTIKLPDGREVEYENLPPDVKQAVDDLETEEKKLDELKKKEEDAKKRLKDLQDNPSVKIVEISDPVPVFDSEYKKCLYECMMREGAIQAGELGIALGLGGLPLGTFPKTPEEINSTKLRKVKIR